MRFPRIFPFPAFVLPHVPEGMAYCTSPACGTWREFDVIKADLANGIPAFPICGHCGVWLNLEEEEIA